MKLHDLRPAEGSRTPKTRVGRGIAAGKGKTAGRGTKGQKARAGGSIPPWFEGGQTPLHRRIPKLRGFRNRFKIDFEVVNVGAIAAAAERGAFETDPHAKGTTASITINQDILRAVGLVRTLNKPLKILGGGELSHALFIVADAFTASARTKIEAAGGSVTVLEVPDRPSRAIGVGEPAGIDPEAESETIAPVSSASVAEPAATESEPAKDAPKPRTRRAKAAPEPDAEPAADATAEAEPEPEPATEDDEAATESPSGDDA